MGLKKYEIVKVGGVNRVRALRSWVVQGRQVNVGDVGGVVFDERTLSQDGDSWIFSGRLDNPLVRVGGDSVVNIGESATSASPFINIFGTSSLDANFNVNFGTVLKSGAKALTPAMMEQGDYAGTVGYLITKVSNPQSVRKTEKVFTGGAAFALPAPATGYQVKAIAVDKEGYVVYSTTYVTGASNIPAGAHAYAYIVVGKSPAAAIVPADVTEAALTFPDRSAATLNIVDSHVTLTGNPVGYVTLDPSVSNGENTTNIVGSTVQVTRTNGTPKLILVCDLINTNASISMQTVNALVYGTYKNVKNLVWSGDAQAALQQFKGIVQATDCNNFVMDDVNIGTAAIAAANASGTPYKFYNCNMNNGRFYHHAQIANTYRDINFDLATADLGKTIASGQILASAEVEGMYRLYSTTGSVFGALVEAHDSVKSLNMTGGVATYGTTIYKDAYLNGLFDFAGTNVFGHKVRSHPLAQVLNVQPRVVQGTFNTIVVGETITGVTANANHVCVPLPFRINGSKGLTINCPTGIEGAIICTDINGVIKGLTTLASGESGVPAAQLVNTNAYLLFAKTGGGAITPEDLAGVTVTVYNGCKIVNTGATAVNMKGDIRVEDNATLVNASITGTGYFGGNSIIQAPSALVGPLPIEGAAYVSDNAVFVPHAVIDGANVALLDMRDNAVFAGSLNNSAASYDITMMGAARCLGTVNNSRSKIIMRGNSFVAEAGAVAPECRGLLTMKDDARVESDGLVAKGHITLCGKYKQTATKMWTGKRVIGSQDAPTYDDNVKTKYDF